MKYRFVRLIGFLLIMIILIPCCNNPKIKCREYSEITDEASFVDDILKDKIPEDAERITAIEAFSRQDNSMLNAYSIYSTQLVTTEEDYQKLISGMTTGLPGEGLSSIPPVTETNNVLVMALNVHGCSGFYHYRAYGTAPVLSVYRVYVSHCSWAVEQENDDISCDAFESGFALTVPKEYTELEFHPSTETIY